MIRRDVPESWPLLLLHMAATERDAGHESITPQVAVRVALAFAFEAEARRVHPGEDLVGAGFQTRPAGAPAPDPEQVFQELIERMTSA